MKLSTWICLFALTTACAPMMTPRATSNTAGPSVVSGVGTATPSATAMGSPSSAQPVGYSLPIECQYVDAATAPPTWLVTCPQGLTSNFLAPSLSQQGWTACSNAPKTWSKDRLAIVIVDFVNRADASGQITQKPLSDTRC